MKKSYFMILMVMSIIFLVACNSNSNESASSSENDDTPDQPQNGEKDIAVIVQTTAYEFYQTVKEGAEAAGEELGYNIDFMGPPSPTDISRQVSMVEDVINQGAAAIALAAASPDALIPPVQKAVEAGIPVVTIDSGIESDLPESFVATDNIEASALAAEEMAELIGESGKVAIVNFTAGTSTAIDRETGFRDKMNEFPNIELLETYYSEGDVAKALKITEDLMTANPDLAGIFAANEASAVGVGRAIDEAGKAGEIQVIGFDSSDTLVSYIEKGVMQGSIVQDPYNIGYMGVTTAINILEGKEVESMIGTNVTYVNQDNLEDEEVQRLLNP